MWKDHLGISYYFSHKDLEEWWSLIITEQEVVHKTSSSSRCGTYYTKIKGQWCEKEHLSEKVSTSRTEETIMVCNPIKENKGKAFSKLNCEVSVKVIKGRIKSSVL